MRGKVILVGVSYGLIAACSERPTPPPVVVAAASAPEPAKPAPPPAPRAATRAVVEVVRADDGTKAAETFAAVPLLCHDGASWIAEPKTCLAALGKGTKVVGKGGTWSVTGEAVQVFDRAYRGVVLQKGAQHGLAYVGVGAPPTSRCRKTEPSPLPLDAKAWAQLSSSLPEKAAFTGGYPGNARLRQAIAGDFDGDGHDDTLVSLTLKDKAGRLDLVVLQRKDDVRVLGQEWTVGNAYGGAPKERRLIDVRSMTCFDLDGRPGLEFVASLRGETEREHQAGSFDGPSLRPVGESVFFGD